MTEGTGATPSLAGSRALAEFMRAGGFDFGYLEVEGNHGSMVPMVWPAIFEFFDRVSRRARGSDMTTRLTRLAVFVALALSAVTAVRAQTELRLWPGKAPGSEKWSLPESVARSPSGDRVITNVSEPTLTVFLPEAAIATGAAAVIAPGGALRVSRVRQRGRQGRPSRAE